MVDTNFRLYVGVKEMGSFQHSSFLQGARVSAAGLIEIRNGKLKKCVYVWFLILSFVDDGC